MYIVVATDNNFVQHCCVTLTSVLRNNTDVTFFLFTEGISRENENLLRSHVEKCGGKILFCIIDSKIVNQFPMPIDGGTHISIATYYRLFMDLLLPDYVDKVLYLDCDIVVRGSLIPLFDIDISKYALGAVYQSYRTGTEEDYDRLCIPKEEGYFNAGVLLINLKYWREKKVRERLFSFIENNFTRIKQHDQDVLNAVLYKEAFPISNTWNYLPIFFYNEIQVFPKKVRYSCHLASPIVIHFVSVPKPWEFGSDHPFRKEYFKYLDLTPFKGWRPKFNYRKFMDHILKPKLIKFILKLDIFNLRSFLHFSKR